MRCPKCQYIGFDNGDRCRNCGYEFSLAVDARPADLPIQTGNEAIGPLADFSLGNAGSRAARLDQSSASSAAAPGTSPFDLPLFKDGQDDAPLVSATAVPRAPLAVRRANPLIARARARHVVEEPELDLDDDEGESFAPEPPAPVVRRSTPAQPPPDRERLPEFRADGDVAFTPAPSGARLLAAFVDLLLLGTIVAAVLYFTLRLCGLGFGEIRVLPVVPMAGFLLLLVGGYFVCFTVAGGQTIGKMAGDIRVVRAQSTSEFDGGVPVSTAVVRAAAYLVTLLSAGLGYLPALVTRERRAIHDRLADTRVVKA